jgi:hypothetical protein
MDPRDGKRKSSPAQGRTPGDRSPAGFRARGFDAPETRAEAPSLLDPRDEGHTLCMGPTCPHCGAIYEWTCGELEEHVTAPKVYFCQECRGLFVLSSEEIEELQERFRPALEEASNEPVDLGEIEPHDGSMRDSSDGDVPTFPSTGGPVPDGPRAQAAQWSARDSTSEAAPAPVDAGPLAPRERVVIVAGPHAGVAGEIAVIAGELVVIRAAKSIVRVLAVHVRRAG